MIQMNNQKKGDRQDPLLFLGREKRSVITMEIFYNS